MKSAAMAWWQCFVGGGTFACLVLLIRMLQKDTFYLAQEAKHGAMSVVGRVAGAFCSSSSCGARSWGRPFGSAIA